MIKKAKRHNIIKNKQEYRVLYRFMMSYIFVIFIMIGIASIAYYDTLDAFSENAKDNNLSILEQSKDILDRNFSEIDNLLVQLSWDSKVQELMNASSSDDGFVYKITDVFKSLQRYVTTNSFISDFFICCNDSGIIVSPYTSYTRLNETDSTFKYGAEDLTKYYNSVLKTYHNREYLPPISVKINNRQKKLIGYIQSVPLGFLNDFKGNILFLVDEIEIHKLLSRLNIDDSGWVYILDGKGNILTSINANKEGYGINFKDLRADTLRGSKVSIQGGKKYVVSYTTSSYNGWVYVAALPYEVVMERVSYVRNKILLFALITLLAGIIAAYFLAYRNSKPLKEILKLLQEFLGRDMYKGKNEYKALHFSIENMIKDTKMVKEVINQQKPLLRAACIEYILRGEFNSVQDMEAFLAQTDLNINGKKYLILLVNLEGYFGEVTAETIEEMSMKRIIIKNYVENNQQLGIYCHNIEFDKTAMLVCFDDEDVDECISQAEKVIDVIHDVLFEEYGIKFIVGAGSIFGNLLDAYSSFHQAKYALTYSMIVSGKDIRWYHKIVNAGNEYYYPIDLEQRMINLIRAGDITNVKKIIDTIYTENFIERSLSGEIAWQLLHEIQGTMNKIINQIPGGFSLQFKNENEKISKLFVDGSVSKVYNYITAILLNTCDAFNEFKKSHNVDLRNSLIEYIESNYKNSSLCLSMIAEQFGVTEVYLSQFFREQTGENFSTYVEKLRIGHADELLYSSSKSINDISEEVGYNSSHAFRRAYKKINGVAPTANRNSEKA